MFMETSEARHHAVAGSTSRRCAEPQLLAVRLWAQIALHRMSADAGGMRACMQRQVTQLF